MGVSRGVYWFSSLFCTRGQDATRLHVRARLPLVLPHSPCHAEPVSGTPYAVNASYTGSIKLLPFQWRLHPVARWQLW